MNLPAGMTRTAGATNPQIAASLLVTGAWLGFIVIWEWCGADRWAMLRLADSHGFALQNNWWLKAVFHDALRWISTLTYAALVFSLWKPFGLLRATSRLQRIEMLVGVTVALLVINRIKFYSLTSCPGCAVAPISAKSSNGCAGTSRVRRSPTSGSKKMRRVTLCCN